MTLALESAIEGVETFYSKRADLRALQSLDQLIERSEISPSEVISEAREPLLIVNQAVPQTADSDHRPIFWARAKGMSLNVKRSLGPVAAPLLRAAMVAIFAVALGAAVSQFGLLGHQAPLSSPSQAEPAPVIEPAISHVNGAPADFRHRHFVAAGSQGDAFRYSRGHEPLTVAPEEQPVKAPRSSCSTQTYKVPSEGGGEASITMVRC